MQPGRQEAIACANFRAHLCGYMAPLGHNGLIKRNIYVVNPWCFIGNGICESESFIVFFYFELTSDDY